MRRCSAALAPTPGVSSRRPRKTITDTDASQVRCPTSALSRDRDRMPFSQKFRPGFDLRPLLPGRRGRGPEAGMRSRWGAIAVAVGLAAATPWPARAEPSAPARNDPEPVVQVAPAAVSGTSSGASFDPGESDTTSRLAAPGAYTEPARARRRTPRPSAEIRPEGRPSVGRA